MKTDDSHKRKHKSHREEDSKDKNFFVTSPFHKEAKKQVESKPGTAYFKFMEAKANNESKIQEETNSISSFESEGEKKSKTAEIMSCRNNFQLFMMNLRNMTSDREEQLKDMLTLVKVNSTEFPSMQMLNRVYEEMLTKELSKKQRKKNWTNQELLVFLFIIFNHAIDLNEEPEELGPEHWNSISEMFYCTKGDACKYRFLSLLKSKVQKEGWTEHEENLLLEIINKKGTKDGKKYKWTEISKELNEVNGGPLRLAKQCRERWYNHLDPSLNKGKWEVNEDILLLEKFKEMGKKWSVIARYIKGRNENAVKNRFYSICKKLAVHPNGEKLDEKEKINFLLEETKKSLTIEDEFKRKINIDKSSVSGTSSRSHTLSESNSWENSNNDEDEQRDESYFYMADSDKEGSVQSESLKKSSMIDETFPIIPNIKHDDICLKSSTVAVEFDRMSEFPKKHVRTRGAGSPKSCSVSEDENHEHMEGIMEDGCFDSDFECLPGGGHAQTNDGHQYRSPKKLEITTDMISLKTNSHSAELLKSNENVKQKSKLTQKKEKSKPQNSKGSFSRLKKKQNKDLEGTKVLFSKLDKESISLPISEVKINRNPDEIKEESTKIETRDLTNKNTPNNNIIPETFDVSQLIELIKIKEVSNGGITSKEIEELLNSMCRKSPIPQQVKGKSSSTMEPEPEVVVPSTLNSTKASELDQALNNNGFNPQKQQSSLKQSPEKQINGTKEQSFNPVQANSSQNLQKLEHFGPSQVGQHYNPQYLQSAAPQQFISSSQSQIHPNMIHQQNPLQSPGYQQINNFQKLKYQAQATPASLNTSSQIQTIINNKNSSQHLNPSIQSQNTGDFFKTSKECVNNLNINFIHNIGPLYGANNMGGNLGPSGPINIINNNAETFKASENNVKYETVEQDKTNTLQFKSQLISNDMIEKSDFIHPQAKRPNNMKRKEDCPAPEKQTAQTKKKPMLCRSKSLLNGKNNNESFEDYDEIVEDQLEQMEPKAQAKLSAEDFGKYNNADINNTPNVLFSYPGIGLASQFKGVGSQTEMLNPNLLAYNNLNFMNLLQNPGGANIFVDKMGINPNQVELPMNLFNNGFDSTTTPSQWMNIQLQRFKFQPQSQHQQALDGNPSQQTKPISSGRYNLNSQSFNNMSHHMATQNQGPSQIPGQFQLYQGVSQQGASQVNQGNPQNPFPLMHQQNSQPQGIYPHQQQHLHQQGNSQIQNFHQMLPPQQPQMNSQINHQLPGQGAQHQQVQYNNPFQQPLGLQTQSPQLPTQALFYANPAPIYNNSQSKLSPQQISNSKHGLNLLYGNNFGISPAAFEENSKLIEKANAYIVQPDLNYKKSSFSKQSPTENNHGRMMEEKGLTKIMETTESEKFQSHEQDPSAEFNKKKFHHRRAATSDHIDLNKLGKKANNKNENKKFLEIIKQEVGPRIDDGSNETIFGNGVGLRNEIIVQDYASIFNQLQNQNIVAPEIERILDKPKTPALLSSVSPQCRELDHNQLSQIFQRVGNQQNESPFLYNPNGTPSGAYLITTSPFSMNNSPFLLQNSPLGIYVENVNGPKLESPSTFLITNPIVGVNGSPVDLVQRVIQNKNM